MRAACAMAGLALVWGTAALADCKVTKLGELPVAMHGFQPMVRATINGRPATFLLDSGAFYSGITPGGAQDYGLDVRPAPGLVVRGVGGVIEAKVATVRQLGLLGTTLKAVEFLVGGSESSEGIGEIGQNILGVGDVEYDLPGGTVRFFRTSGCGDTGLAYWAQNGGFFSVDLKPPERAGQFLIATVYVNDKPVDAVFDTGASVTILSLRAAARAGVHPGDPGTVLVDPVRGIGRTTSVASMARFHTVRIGNEQLANVRLRIGDIGKYDMIVGADFFVSHRMFVSNSAHRIDFTYTGGQVFNAGARTEGEGAKAATIASAAKAEGAEALGRRAAMALSQGNPDAALEDLNAAVAAAPGDAAYLAQRARVQVARHDEKAARADLDAAIRLDPADGEARLLRARLRIHDGDRDGALADLDAAAGTVGQAGRRSLELGELYTSLDAFDRAIAAQNAWIAVHPFDVGTAGALNGRCWARALAGKELKAALADCNAAIRAAPREAAYIDSRAVVEYRLGDSQAALNDASAALAIRPNLAWSLWVRALIGEHGGAKQSAAADRAAAVAIDPAIAASAARYGVK